MGAVYKAHDTQLDRTVGIKIPKFDATDTDLLERFYREARSAATLSHAGICPVHDVGEIDGTHYISMGYIEGRELSAYINPEKPISAKKTATIVRRMAIALDEAHQNGVVHRDLKPDNVMIDAKSNPVIMDFGLARRTASDGDSRMTQSGQLIGTPAYMSPEQVDGDVEKMGPKSDIYSLGVILYEMLTGRVPYEGSIARVLAQVIQGNPQRPSDIRQGVDPRLESICLKMMASNLDERHASMGAVVKELTAFLKGQPTSAKESLLRETAPADRAGSAETLVVPPAAPAAESSPAAGLPKWAIPAGAGVLGIVLVVALTLTLPDDTSPDSVPTQTAATQRESDNGDSHADEHAADVSPAAEENTATVTTTSDQSTPPEQPAAVQEEPTDYLVVVPGKKSALNGQLASILLREDGNIGPPYRSISFPDFKPDDDHYYLLKAHPQKPIVYVSGKRGELRGFSVSREGDLSELPGSPFEAPAVSPGRTPVGLSHTPTPDGRFIFAGWRAGAPGDQSHSNLPAYRVEDDGQLTLLPDSVSGVVPLPVYDVVIHPSSRFLYAKTDRGDDNLPDGAASVYGFRIESSGALTPLSGSPVVPLPGDVPRHHSCRLWMDPLGEYLVVGGLTEAGGHPWLLAHSIDSSSGAILLRPESRHNPEAGKYFAMWTHPGGYFYMCRGGGSGLIGFTLDRPAGTFQRIPALESSGMSWISPFGATPDGRFIYVGELDSQSMQVRSLSNDAGTLDHVKKYNAPIGSGVFVRVRSSSLPSAAESQSSNVPATSNSNDAVRQAVVWAVNQQYSLWGGRVGGGVRPIRKLSEIPDGRLRIDRIHIAKDFRNNAESYAYLRALNQLREFYCSRKNFDDKAMAALADAPNLEAVSLPYAPVGVEGMRVLKELPSLKSLMLGTNNPDGRNKQANDEAMAVIATFPKLQFLTLQHCTLTDVGMKSLEKATQLKSLSIRNCPISDESVASFREAVPGCEVKYERDRRR